MCKMLIGTSSERQNVYLRRTTAVGIACLNVVYLGCKSTRNMVIYGDGGDVSFIFEHGTVVV